MSIKTNASRFLEINEFSEGQQSRYLVGGGDSRAGQRGLAIATIAVKHCRGYGVILRLDSGKQDVFDPQHLYPDMQ